MDLSVVVARGDTVALMSHFNLKLVPGVDLNRTPTLNEAAISSCNLIRSIVDRGGQALVQKLGGWTRFYPNSLGSIVRSLWAWQDLNNNEWLVAGGETSSTSGVGAPLTVITGGVAKVITPQVGQHNVAVAVTVSTTTNIAAIRDTGSNITQYVSVFVNTHISVGGVIVFGFYQCLPIGANTYDVALNDVLGNPVFPTSSVTTGGVVAKFTVVSGSAAVTVELPNHGFAPGNTYPCLVTTTVGGISLFGNYTIQAVPDADHFTINAATQATASTSAFINGGLAQYDYYYGQGPLPEGAGYGSGGYGRGGYGTGVAPSGVSGTNIEATDWALDNWGETLIACPQGVDFGPDGALPVGGPIYAWSPASNLPVATPINTGPVANAGCFVAMPQRQIIAWGSTFNGIQDPLLVRWCDIGDYSSQSAWIALPTNQAGSYRIPRGSRIVGGLQAGQQGILWTDLAVWAMQYINQPFVYSFNEIGTGCGLIAPKAGTSLNGTIYWMSQSQFFTSTGAGVQPLYCPVWDAVFQDLDTANLNKIRVAPNSRFNEIAWYYPVAGGNGQTSNYVKYNTLLQQWDIGTLGRSAWLNQSVLGPPIGGDNNGLLQQHETSNDADGQAMDSSFTTGYFEMSEGNWQTFVDMIFPDMKFGLYGSSQNATILMTFFVAQYPGDAPLVIGPYTITQATQYVSTRLRGRLVSIKIESNDIGSFWRLGNMRYRGTQDGRF